MAGITRPWRLEQMKVRRKWTSTSEYADPANALDVVLKYDRLYGMYPWRIRHRVTGEVYAQSIDATDDTPVGAA